MLLQVLQMHSHLTEERLLLSSSVSKKTNVNLSLLICGKLSTLKKTKRKYQKMHQKDQILNETRNHKWVRLELLLNANVYPLITHANFEV